jgi:hypothetical protein
MKIGWMEYALASLKLWLMEREILAAKRVMIREADRKAAGIITPWDVYEERNGDEN